VSSVSGPYSLMLSVLCCDETMLFLVSLSTYCGLTQSNGGIHRGTPIICQRLLASSMTSCILTMSATQTQSPFTFSPRSALASSSFTAHQQLSMPQVIHPTDLVCYVNTSRPIPFRGKVLILYRASIPPWSRRMRTREHILLTSACPHSSTKT
jgi:hypothetical protein